MTITDKQTMLARIEITVVDGITVSDKAMRAALEAAEAAMDMWPLAERVRTALDRANCPDAYMRIAVETITAAAPSSAEQAGKVEHIGGWRINRDTDTVEHEQDGAWHYWGTVAEFESNRAAPSAPAADERADFEACMRPHLSYPNAFDRDPIGSYVYTPTSLAWIAWHTRAKSADRAMGDGT